MTQAISPFSSATDMCTALRQRTISARELVEMHLARIETFDGAINSIPVLTFDRAREAAIRADAAIARGVRRYLASNDAQRVDTGCRAAAIRGDRICQGFQTSRPRVDCQSTYPMWATHTGQPSTAFPAG